MQCADVFFLKADVCQLGLDQRKVNMLARDYAQVAGRRFKPVILSHHMVFGLKEGHVKMSKSDPDSAIFMEDSKSEVERKVKSAYCPTSGPELDLNPCLDYVRTICFHERNPLPFAGGKFKSADEVKNALVAGELLPDDLKTALADHLNQLLEPVRTKFSEEGSRPKELLELIQMFKAEDLKEKQQKVGSVFCVPLHSDN
jgi:tyrosyl-tRNA synthetase